MFDAFSTVIQSALYEYELFIEGIPTETLIAAITVPHFLNVQYQFGEVTEILELEFTKMLEANVRFRKCKRCGKYFIMKDNYDTNYCDRVADGETRNCQELAAAENYKAKIAGDNAILIIRISYTKYMKGHALISLSIEAIFAICSTPFSVACFLR